MKPLHVEVRNPYFKGGHFRVLLIERGGVASGREALSKSGAGDAGGGKANGQAAVGGGGARDSRLQLDKAYWDVLSTLWRAKQQGKQKQRKMPIVQPRIRKSLAGASGGTASNRPIQTPATENASVTTVRTGNASFPDSGTPPSKLFVRFRLFAFELMLPCNCNVCPRCR